MIRISHWRRGPWIIARFERAALTRELESRQRRHPPSKSLTLDHAAALLKVSDGTRIGAYIALPLGAGIRTEEARALAWEHVDFGDPQGTPPRPASIAVWRSVRAHGDTKTAKSRRTLGLPAFANSALADLQQREQRDSGPVFATRDGGELDAANVRREFRAVIKAAGIPGAWSPRELRHTFVSLMSDSGVPVEAIARLAGHTKAAPPSSSTDTSSALSWKKALRQWTSSSDALPDGRPRRPIIPR